MTATAAIIALFCHECEVVDKDGHVIVESRSLLLKPSINPKLSDISLLMEDLPQVELVLERLTSSSSKSSWSDSSLTWDDALLARILDYLHQITPAIRVPATLVRYSHVSSPPRGVVRLGLPPRCLRFVPVRTAILDWGREIGFSEADSPVFGNLRSLPGQAIRIDLTSEQLDVPPSSIFGDPKLFATLFSEQPSRRDRILRKWHQHRRSIGILFIALLLFWITEVVGIGTLKTWIPWQPFRYLAQFLVWLGVAAVGNAAYDEIRTKGTRREQRTSQ